MDRTERERLIAMYEDGHRVVLDALAGITDAEWERREAPGEWSPRQIAHHLGESEMIAAGRLRRVLVEDDAVIRGYDERAFADRLWYDRPVDASLAAFKAARDVTAPILRLMTDADWARTGTHTEFGPFSAEQWLAWYGPHAHDHADQIRRARKGL